MFKIQFPHLREFFLLAIIKLMNKKVFIGVAWPYLNGDIHIGHLAGYLLPADIFARFNRFLGNETLMVSGSDCFGTPVMIEAESRGLEPREIVEEYHKKNVELFKFLGISFDIYTKTETKNHKETAQKLFLSFIQNGFIFKNKTNQYYSETEKRFLPDRLVEGECPKCGYVAARGDQCDNCGAIFGEGELLNPKSRVSGGGIQLKKTEHYFFDWSKLQPFLEKYVGNHSSWRRWVFSETEGWLKKGLKPRAITRDLEWGIEIPIDRIPENLRIEGAEKKRIYVWFEAVIGYLSASIEWAEKNGKKWEDFWYDSESCHAYFMGKDNLIFHTLFWPGQLHAYDEKLHLPDFPAVNQFLNLEGQKFSKSRGITIDSKYIVEKYGLDAVRFYLCLIMPENADANFSWGDFVNKNNDILIGNLGNFINRTLTLARGLEFSPEYKLAEEVESEVEKAITAVKKHLETYEYKKYLETVLALSNFGNKYLSKTEPWFKKDETEEFRQTTFNAVFITSALLILIQPLLINAFKKLSELLGIKIEHWPTDGVSELKILAGKISVKEVQPLFQKIDESVIESEKSKIKYFA